MAANSTPIGCPWLSSFSPNFAARRSADSFFSFPRYIFATSLLASSLPRPQPAHLGSFFLCAYFPSRVEAAVRGRCSNAFFALDCFARKTIQHLTPYLLTSDCRTNQRATERASERANRRQGSNETKMRRTETSGQSSCVPVICGVFRVVAANIISSSRQVQLCPLSDCLHFLSICLSTHLSFVDFSVHRPIYRSISTQVVVGHNCIASHFCWPQEKNIRRSIRERVPAASSLLVLSLHNHLSDRFSLPYKFFLVISCSEIPRS